MHWRSHVYRTERIVDLMARMSVDDSVQRDPRITKLAKLTGWSRRETLGCLVMDVWPITYDQRTAVIAADLVDLAAGLDGFAQYMVDADLATWVRGNRKVRISGAEERIEYLDHKRKAGRVGGLRSAESRNKNPSSGGSTPQAAGNPPVPSPVPVPASSPVPVLEEKNSAAPLAGGAFDLFKGKVDAAMGDVGKARARKPKKPFECTAQERHFAMFVLAKVGSRNGVSYTGTDEHVRLIVNQIRNGVTVDDMRKVLGYCSIALKWSEKPELTIYLRPETLFGPQTISKYLDPARSWWNTQGLELEPIPMEAA